MAARAAEHGRRVVLGEGPELDRVILTGGVAVDARVPAAAAREADGHHVVRLVVMAAPGLCIHVEPVYRSAVNGTAADAVATVPEGSAGTRHVPYCSSRVVAAEPPRHEERP